MEESKRVIVVVCLLAYILIYLRALNWTSYSFGLHWSHSREQCYHCTLGHAGIWSCRGAMYTASCFDVCRLRAYAASRGINTQSPDERTDPHTRDLVDFRIMNH